MNKYIIYIDWPNLLENKNNINAADSVTVIVSKIDDL